MKKALVLVLILSLVLSVAGCGKKEATAPNDQKPNASAPAEKAYDDTIPMVVPENDGVLATLPKEIQADYTGLNSKVIKSPYADFKAVEKPWKIYFCAAFRGNAWQEAYIGTFEKNVEAYKKAGYVSDYVFTNANGDLNTQIQQVQTAIEKGANFIIINALSPSALDNVIKQAYDKGIVVMTYSGAVTSPYALNILANGYMFSAIETSLLVKHLNGEGNILVVEGMSAHPANEFAQNGIEAVLKNNPGIKYNVVAGNWVNDEAKSAVLKYLATHPEPIDGILQQTGMFLGCQQALEQSGRDLVPITFSLPDQAAIAFAYENKGKPGWATMGSCNPAAEIADTNFRIGVATLMGFGPKVNTFLAPAPKITDENIDEWYKPEYKIDSVGVADLPKDLIFNQEWMKAMFTTEPVLPLDTVLHSKQ